MRLINKTPQVDRRSFLATTGAALVVTATAVMCPTESWALEAKNLKPETVRTLIKMSRDIYPHDRLADKYYAVAVKGMDDKSASGAPLQKQLDQLTVIMAIMAGIAFLVMSAIGIMRGQPFNLLIITGVSMALSLIHISEPTRPY